jgi:hypothetical protein
MRAQIMQGFHTDNIQWAELYSDAYFQQGKVKQLWREKISD